jgi:hypothetical protein
MAHWVLVCPSCNKDFKLWEIPSTSITDFFLPPKPVLPLNGLVTRCPHCGHDGVYHRTDVRYRVM